MELILFFSFISLLISFVFWLTELVDDTGFSSKAKTWMFSSLVVFLLGGAYLELAEREVQDVEIHTLYTEDNLPVPYYVTEKGGESFVTFLPVSVKRMERHLPPTFSIGDTKYKEVY